MAFSFPQLRNRVADWQVNGTHQLGTSTVWVGQWPFDAHHSRRVTPPELLNPPARRLTLAGDFQRFEFFAGERERIRKEWLLPLFPHPPRQSRALAVCLTASESEAKSHRHDLEESPPGACVGEDEVRRVVRLTHAKEIVFITDHAEHPLVAAMADLQPELIVCAGWQQVVALRSFATILLSQDVVQWWGAFLSTAEEIYFPKTDRGPWSRPEPALLPHEHWWQGIDLRVPDEERYIYDW